MPAPSTHYGRQVTGNYRVRRGWLGRLVLQVEVENPDRLSDVATKWIDAIEYDLFPLDWHACKKPYQPLRDNRIGN